MKNLSFYRFLAILFLGCTLVAACKPEGKDTSRVILSGDKKPVLAKVAPRFRRAAGGPVVLLALGESWASRPEILADITAEYGLLEDGGMLNILRYPEDFLTEGRVRLSALTAEASDAAVSMVIALGTPQGTSRELMRIRSSRSDIRLVSVFPEDEILPAEAASDLVLDQAISGDILADEGDLALTEADISFLLLVASLAGEKILPGSSVSKLFPDVLESARKTTGRRMEALSWTFKPCIDPDTGLKAFNHLLLDVRRE